MSTARTLAKRFVLKAIESPLAEAGYERIDNKSSKFDNAKWLWLNEEDEVFRLFHIEFERGNAQECRFRIRLDVTTARASEARGHSVRRMAGGGTISIYAEHALYGQPGPWQQLEHIYWSVESGEKRIQGDPSFTEGVVAGISWLESFTSTEDIYEYAKSRELDLVFVPLGLELAKKELPELVREKLANAVVDKTKLIGTYYRRVAERYDVDVSDVVWKGYKLQVLSLAAQEAHLAGQSFDEIDSSLSAGTLATFAERLESYRSRQSERFRPLEGYEAFGWFQDRVHKVAVEVNQDGVTFTSPYGRASLLLAYESASALTKELGLSLFDPQLGEWNAVAPGEQSIASAYRVQLFTTSRSNCIPEDVRLRLLAQLEGSAYVRLSGDGSVGWFEHSSLDIDVVVREDEAVFHCAPDRWVHAFEVLRTASQLANDFDLAFFDPQVEKWGAISPSSECLADSYKVQMFAAPKVGDSIPEALMAEAIERLEQQGFARLTGSGPCGSFRRNFESCTVHAVIVEGSITFYTQPHSASIFEALMAASELSDTGDLVVFDPQEGEIVATRP